MFEILVYLYETYYRPDACPDTAALAKKLHAVGFEDEEIVAALDWLTGLATTSAPQSTQSALNDSVDALQTQGFRVFAEQESNALGTAAMGFIQYLSSAGLIQATQRELIIERAIAINESPVPLDKLKVIVLMILWSQGKEPDALMFDELMFSEEDDAPRLFH
jgi:Smg protein